MPERALLDDNRAKRFERPEEERLARRIVADAEYDVVKHPFLPKCVGLREA